MTPSFPYIVAISKYRLSTIIQSILSIFSRVKIWAASTGGRCRCDGTRLSFKTTEKKTTTHLNSKCLHGTRSRSTGQTAAQNQTRFSCNRLQFLTWYPRLRFQKRRSDWCRLLRLFSVALRCSYFISARRAVGGVSMCAGCAELKLKTLARSLALRAELSSST